MSDLLEYLRCNKDNRGIMAALRSAIVPGRMERSWPYLARFNGIGTDHRTQVVQTIAALYALHPQESAEGNLGGTCRALCSGDERPATDSTPGPMGKRMQRLLAAERNEICRLVVRIVMRAKSQGKAVNYVSLEKDLLFWGDTVRERWAREFWLSGEKQKSASDKEAPHGVAG